MMQFLLHRFLVEVSFWAQWWSLCLAILFASYFCRLAYVVFGLLLPGMVWFRFLFALPFGLVVGDSLLYPSFVFVFCFIKLPGFIKKNIIVCLPYGEIRIL